jgi:DNA anti-recombination protein RmuC
VLTETSEANKILHSLTTKYEVTLQKQIELLTDNQKLMENKEQKEQAFSKRIDDVTGQYEVKISDLEATLKENVKKVTKMQGSGMLKMLMKNERFQEEVKKQGGDIARIMKGMDTDAIVKEI